jgi:hypothetical protein
MGRIQNSLLRSITGDEKELASASSFVLKKGEDEVT